MIDNPGGARASAPGGNSRDKSAADPAGRKASLANEVGQIVLVFQGGGALGAYQAGVYHALHEAGVEPDWVIGTSIGAINASLIAGNEADNRLPRLREFWDRMQHDGLQGALSSVPFVGAMMANFMTVANGLPAFFKPNPLAFMGQDIPLGPEAVAYYSTSPLAATLGELVDFDRINRGDIRLTVGAANVRTSAMRYFDSRDERLSVRHIMASGALPPAFPPIRIKDELYWDGGILSNTPVEAIFDDKPRRNSLVFAVHLWNPEGPAPTTLAEVSNRQKDLQYSSRANSHIDRQKQLHRLRHIIAELHWRLPESEKQQAAVRELAGYGCVTRMHVVRLLAPMIEGENHARDIDFTASGIAKRWAAGRQDMKRILEDTPWVGDFDPLEGFVLHEARPSAMTSSS